MVIIFLSVKKADWWCFFLAAVADLDRGVLLLNRGGTQLEAARV